MTIETRNAAPKHLSHLWSKNVTGLHTWHDEPAPWSDLSVKLKGNLLLQTTIKASSHSWHGCCEGMHHWTNASQNVSRFKIHGKNVAECRIIKVRICRFAADSGSILWQINFNNLRKYIIWRMQVRMWFQITQFLRKNIEQHIIVEIKVEICQSDLILRVVSDLNTEINPECVSSLSVSAPNAESDLEDNLRKKMTKNCESQDVILVKKPRDDCWGEIKSEYDVSSKLKTIPRRC